MSNYYYRFGFVTCSAYCQSTIEKLKLGRPADKDLDVLRGYNEENLKTYESLRQCTFQSEWGMVIRTEPFWRWIGYQISHLHKYDFFQIMSGDLLVGYFISSESQIVDFGFSDSEFDGCVSKMLTFLSERNKKESLTLRVSLSNKIFRSMGLSNISHQMRYVPDEGIICLGLNSKNLVHLFCRIVSKYNEREGKLAGEFSLGKHLAFRFTSEGLEPLFDPFKIDRCDVQSLVSGLFLGTYGPLSLDHFSGPPILPPTFFRFNDLDTM